MREDYRADGDAGVTFRLMTRARGPTGGARTAWRPYATASSAFVLRSRFGTVATLSLRSEFSGSPAPEAITARTPRNTGGTATPTASWLRWRCHYPQAVFPYPRLREQRARRTRDDPEFELLDGDRYWQIAADYAKAAPDDILDHRAQRRTRAGRAPYSADAVVPQPMVLGEHRHQTCGSRRVQLNGMRRDRRGGHAQRMKVVAGSDPQASRNAFCFAKTRPTFRNSSAQPHPLSQGLRQRSRRQRRSDSQSRSTRHEDGVLVPRCSRSRETVELRLRLARNAPGKAMDLGDAFIQSELIESAKPITCRGARGVSPRAWHVQAELGPVFS
jgi:hypothetical protein